MLVELAPIPFRVPVNKEGFLSPFLILLIIRSDKFRRLYCLFILPWLEADLE